MKPDNACCRLFVIAAPESGVPSASSLEYLQQISISSIIFFPSNLTIQQ